jgi:CDP-diacylglycerol--serine O-phosphatidyltransferase
MGLAEAGAGRLKQASGLILVGALLDVLDGLAARLLKAHSPIGKDLDSLADVVTFGALPGMVLFKLMQEPSLAMGWTTTIYLLPMQIAYMAFVIPVFSALRLARFNQDTRQGEHFRGVPTPANALVVASFPLMLAGKSFIGMLVFYPGFLPAFIIVMSGLMVSDWPLMSLKIKNFSWTQNKFLFTFLILSTLLLLVFRWGGIPLVFCFYLVFSWLHFRQHPIDEQIPLS